MRPGPNLRGFALPLFVVTIFLTDSSEALGNPFNPENKKALDCLQEGNRFYERGDLDSAIKLYEKGLRFEEAPMFFFNLAQVYRELGNYEKALHYYERLIATGRLSEKEKTNIQSRMETTRGLKTAAEERDRQEQEEKESAKDPPPRGEEIPLPLPTDAQPPVEPWYFDRIAWLLVGGGVAAGIASGGFLLSSSSLSDQASREESESERERLRSLSNKRETTALVLGIGGGVLATLGAIKLTISPKRPPPQAAGVAVVLGPQFVGLEGRF